MDPCNLVCLFDSLTAARFSILPKKLALLLHMTERDRDRENDRRMIFAVAMGVLRWLCFFVVLFGFCFHRKYNPCMR